VRQEANLPDAEVEQDLGADAVVAQIGREAERLVGLHRVEAVLLLELIRAQLGEQADAAAFLRHVEQHAPAGLADLGHRLVQLRAAVAQQALEDVAGQALAVDAHEHRLLLYRHAAIDLEADAADAQRQVRFGIDHGGVGDELEIAVQGRQGYGELAADQALALPAVLDD